MTTNKTFWATKVYIPNKNIMMALISDGMNALVFLRVMAVPSLVKPIYISQIPVTILIALVNTFDKKITKRPIVIADIALISVVPSSVPNCFF